MENLREDLNNNNFKEQTFGLCQKVADWIDKNMSTEEIDEKDLANKVNRSPHYIRLARRGEIDFKMSTIAKFESVFENKLIKENG